jgi:2-oxoglutarate/2-oxoacid ferredoxin oxidoreductase subunit beta
MSSWQPAALPEKFQWRNNMPSIVKPVATHPSLQRNDLGLTIRDYEGTMSTLCAGCGHDSITAALTRALWEVAAEPHMIAKLSGIGCSSKTPAYFVNGAHGLNSAHGRMPPIATGANAANRELIYIGISGDGDSLSIGLGHMCHAIRRNVRMVYVIENNGVYGLTKGQFSASADVGSKSKRGEPNRMAPIDSVMLGLSLGATFIARSFSGDKEQLVPILKAAVSHRGFALIDVISPCVTFNDHEGSTKSYLYTRQHELKATETDFVPPASEILAQIGQNGAVNVTMHDGSMVRFKGVPPNYDPTDRGKVMDYLEEHHGKGEVVTGLLYLDESVPDLHEMNKTTDIALTKVPYDKLCPGAAALDRLQEDFR